VLAAAGAGKTRVLTRRIALRVTTGTAGLEHVLAITFTRKAAGELRDRLTLLGTGDGLVATTFHSFALSQLRRWWADRRCPEPALVDRKARLISELIQERPLLREIPVAELAGQVEWAKARLVAPDSFAEAARQARRELPADADAIGALYARYEHEKRRRRIVDFDDLLWRYADALCSDGRFAAAQRWRWRHVFVDELQDVNPLQCRALLALLGDNRDIFVVGDPNQAIYGWNGADPAFLNEFPERWPGAEVVRLDDNHRSTPQIVAAAAAVLGRQCQGELRSSRADGPQPLLRSFASEEAEAAGISAQVRDAHRAGLDWSQMAVLARVNSQLVGICDALTRAGVPFQSLGSNEDTEEPARKNGDDAPGPGRALAGSGEDLGKVTVCSFHRAKGLQWRAVWVCGLEAGTVPIAYASSPAALAEERRLLYVALTRAETALACSWARQRRTAAGVALPREPSPWLPALAGHCNVFPAGDGDDRPALGPPAGAPGHLDASTVDFLTQARRRLSRAKPPPGRRRTVAGWCSADQDEDDRPHPQAAGEAVVSRLTEWRRRLARASGVPAHVLLHDATICALAERQPTSVQELLAVPGLGPVKVARYGPAILEVVRGAVAPTADLPDGLAVSGDP